jgi:Zn-dependent protease with chaperone function
MAGVASTQRCPQCGATVPVLPSYSTWCECGWNLAPPARDEPSSRLARLSASLGRRLGDQMAQELASTERLQPRLTAARVGAYLVAAFVYALTIALAVGGVLLFLLTFPHIAGGLAGFLMTASAVLMRPRLGSLPDEELVRRDEAPALYGLAHEVADALGTPRVDAIAIDHTFNASWSIVGLRRRRLLTLGLPLLAALEPAERVAAIAHELAHGRNGDATRGLLVGSSIRGLAQLYLLLSPAEDDGVIAWVLTRIYWLLSRPVLALLLLQLHLALRDAQRAEYLADAMAAEVAGTDAMIGTHEKLLLEPLLYAAVGRAARAASNERVDAFDELAATISRVPERERERRRRIARLEEARLDATHPPTAKRIELLARRPAHAGRVAATGQRTAAIDEELRGRRRVLQARLVDEFRDALYY